MDSTFAFWRKRFEFNDIFTLFHIAPLKLINLNLLKVSHYVWITKERYWSHCLLRWRPEADDRWIKPHVELQVCENITVLCYQIKYSMNISIVLIFPQHLLPSYRRKLVRWLFDSKRSNILPRKWRNRLTWSKSLRGEFLFTLLF